MKRLNFVVCTALALLIGLALGVHVSPAVAQDQPVSVLINGLRYDQARNVFNLSMTVSNPEEVWRVIVTVEESEGGTLVDGAGVELEPHGRETLNTELSAANFKPGRKYRLRVQAVNTMGTFLQKPDQNGSKDPSELTMLAVKEFVYDKAQPTPVPFGIESVNPRFDLDKLVIVLDVPEAERVLKYEGFIVDKSGQRVLNFGPSLFNGKELVVDLPSVMKQQPEGEAPEYKLTVYLTTKDELRSQAVLENIKVNPPPPPSWTDVAMTSLRQNPVIQGGVVLIIVLVVSWIIISGRRKRKPEMDLVRPPIDSTRRLRPSAPGAHLRIRILQSPGSARGTEKMVNHFPCVIGREDCDITISDDRQISRRHVEIRLRDGQFFLMDLESKNGTFIGDVALRPRALIQVNGTTSVRLGTQTFLELEPEA